MQSVVNYKHEEVIVGINLTAAAGFHAYAEATPTLEYQEQQSPQGGKVGESRLKGHFEAADIYVLTEWKEIVDNKVSN